ncbi:hypothetical protein BpHYR1_014033, partial [Brachionus plicatilis]
EIVALTDCLKSDCFKICHKYIIHLKKLALNFLQYLEIRDANFFPIFFKYLVIKTYFAIKSQD